jgi:Flp pilus assembly protein TadG
MGDKTILDGGMKRIWRAVTSFREDQSAVSAIEFALIFPVMLLLYVGGFETGQLLSAYRRVGHVSSTVGDLVSQVSSIDATEMSNVFDASTAIMMPFDTTNLKMTASSVLYSSGALKVSWSKTRNGTAWTVGSAPPVTIPTALLVSGQEIIVSQVEYTYSGIFTSFLNDLLGSSSIDMSDTTFYRPRVSSTITFE